MMSAICKIAATLIAACIASAATAQPVKKTVEQIIEEVIAIRTEALRMNRIKPVSVSELAGVFDAEDGHNLANAPKISPDGKWYYFAGKITAVADEKGFILDSRLLSDRIPYKPSDAPGVAVDYKTGPSGPEYISIQPNNDVSKASYLEKGKVDRDVIGVGRYVRNSEIKLTSGRTIKIPHFNAIYLVMAYH